jgi:rod shape-determining protein MreD
MNGRREGHWPFIVSLVLGLLLMLFPLPPAGDMLRPYFLALVLIYWTVEGDFRLGLGTSFALGLFLDIATASLLGQHALGLVIIVYLVQRFRSRIRFFPMWQQALAVLVLLVNDRIILLWILLFQGSTQISWTFWLAPLSGALLWPWLFLALDRVRRVARSGVR